MALACKVGMESDVNGELIAPCLRLLAMDVKELFELYQDKFHWLQHEHEVGDIFNNWNKKKGSCVGMEADELLDQMNEFCNTRYIVTTLALFVVICTN